MIEKIINFNATHSDMGRIMGCLRNLVQIRLLVKSLLDRYARIIKESVKLMGYVFRLILLSVNYRAALIVLPIVVFFMTRLITKDYLIPSIASIAAVGIYFIFMSNYFSKGMHQFGTNRIIKLKDGAVEKIINNKIAVS